MAGFGVFAAGFTLGFPSFLETSAKKKRVVLFAFLLLVASVYATLQSGNNFQHYKLYLFVPLLLCIALTSSVNRIEMQRYLFLVLLGGSLIQAGVNIIKLLDMSGPSEFTALHNKVVKSIEQHSLQSDPIVVWGWRDALYVDSKRPMGYRDAHPFHFSLHSPLLPFWTHDFIFDMEKNRPKLFIEAMIPSFSERGDLLLSHDEVPAIEHYIRQHYMLIEELEDVKIFKRR